jgi:hypothetical protein
MNVVQKKSWELHFFQGQLTWLYTKQKKPVPYAYYIL